MKFFFIAVVMALGFVFLPWWGTYILGVFVLLFSPGYIPLFFMILLDFFALPQVFPYASASFLIFLVIAYLIKDRMFDGVV